MSRFELDDLIGAFKGQAIGQEALDLALLQKQLAASLRPASSGMAYPAFSASSNAGPSTSRCTTPTSSAPYYSPSYASSSYGAQAGASTPVGMRSRSRSASRTRAMSMDESNDWDEMQEVEDELVSHMEGTSSYMGEEASSYGYYPAQMEYGTYQQQQQGQQRYHAPRSSFPASASASIPPAPQTQTQSSFASSDPFYLATLAQSQPAPASAFSAPSPSFSNASPYPAQQQVAGNGGGGNWFAPPVGFAAYAPSSTGTGSGNASSTSRWTAHRSATAAAAV